MALRNLYLRGRSTPRRRPTLAQAVRRRYVPSTKLRQLCDRNAVDRLPYNVNQLGKLECTSCHATDLVLRMAYEGEKIGHWCYGVRA